MNRTKLLLVSLLSAASLLPLTGCKPGEGQALAGARYQNCAACHGNDGRGNQEVGAPAIAGLPDWYVKAQLTKFRGGIRGLHPDDVEGLKMRAMAKVLDNDQEINLVATYVSQLPPIHPAATLIGGDPGRGKSLFQACIQCHGERGTGLPEKGAANLNRTGDWYLLTQLKKFKAGIRGVNPADITGSQMRPMASTLPDEQAMKDVIAYIGTLEGK